MAKALRMASGRPPVDEPEEHIADWVARQPDAMAAWWAQRLTPGHRRRPYIGARDGGVILGQADTHALFVGPPRSVGKTSGGAVTNALSHVGPAAVISTKWDPVQILAMGRARMAGGRAPLWWYSPTGEEPPPGLTELRFSPLTERCRNWDHARLVAHALVGAASVAGSDRGRAQMEHPHFGPLASQLLNALIFYAANYGLSMRWVVGMVQAKRKEDLNRVLEDLTRDHSHLLAADFVEGIAEGESKEVHSIFTTAQVALDPWTTEGALRVSEDPNFDADAFVQGLPETPNRDFAGPGPDPALAALGIDARPPGCWPTVFISASSEDQTVAALLIITLLTEIQRAAFRLTASNEKARVRYGRPSVAIICDELAGLAPLPQLPTLLREGGSQGIQVIGCIQDLGDMEARWGEQAAKSMLTTFNNVVLLPGIRDTKTLHIFSELAGSQWVPQSSATFGRAGAGGTTSVQQVPRLPIDVLYQGHPQSPDLAMAHIQGQAPGWTFITPYYRSEPWPQCLVDTMTYWSQRLDRPEAQLPFPDLDRDGDGAHLLAANGGHGLLDLYRRAEAALLDAGARSVDEHLEETA